MSIELVCLTCNSSLLKTQDNIKDALLVAKCPKCGHVSSRILGEDGQVHSYLNPEAIKSNINS